MNFVKIHAAEELAGFGGRYINGLGVRKNAEKDERSRIMVIH